jgi:hypothetical protein
MSPIKARRMVRAAVIRGDLVRPDACEKCGDTKRRRDGHSNIQGHHHDYSKPLDVEWLCAMCHRKETPLPAVMGAPTPGSRNGAAKLTEAQAREIRASPFGCRSLSRIYGVDKKAIQRIRNGTQWRQA